MDLMIKAPFPVLCLKNDSAIISNPTGFFHFNSHFTVLETLALVPGFSQRTAI